MKTRFKLLLSSSLALPLIGFGPVLAHVHGEDTTNTDTTNTTTETETTPTAEQKAAMLKRVQARKDALKIKLADAEQKRLQSRCKNAQGKVASLKGRINGLETSHGKVYGNLVDHLTTLSGKLKAQGVDTTQLDAQIDELKTKVEKFKTDLTTYKEDISDLATMDCTADPTGFKASLEASRAKLAVVRQDATDIKTFVKGTIRPTLTDIRKQLDPSSTDEDAKSETDTQQPTTGGGTQ